MQRDACARSSLRAPARRARASRCTRSSTGRSSSSTRSTLRNPVGSPIHQLACLRPCATRSRGRVATRAASPSRSARCPATIARSSVPRALRVCADVLLDEARARAPRPPVVERLELDHRLVAARRERAVVVEDVGDAAAHARARSCGRSGRARRPCRRSCTRSRDRPRPRRRRARRCCAPRSARPPCPRRTPCPLVAP